MQKILIGLILGLLAPAAMAAIEAKLDRSEITINDSVQLIISLTGSDVDEGPDLSELEKDFTVLGHSTSTQITIINGKQERHMDLIYTMMPKHEGTINIPSLTIGSSKTPELKIKVTTEAEQRATQDKSKPVMLMSTIEPKSGIVQGQLTYTIQLYYAARMTNGQLTRPEIDNAIVRRIGDDLRFQTEREGRLYQVLERQYAIFPQNSGTLKIPPVVFTAMIEDQRMDSREMGAFMRGYSKPIRLSTDEKKISIQAIPAAFKGQLWLPASKVELRENWEVGENLHVGDPITRTIELTVHGVTTSQLPELKFPEQEGMNIYPDKAQASEQIDGTEIVSRRVWRVSYIPTKAGKIKIPEVKVSWWNTEKKRAELSKVPAKEVSILGVSTTAPVQPPAAIEQPTPKVIVSTSKTPWIFAGLFALGWAITALLWWKKQRSTTTISTPATTIAPPKPKAYLQALKQACQDNQPQVAYRALLAWANAMWPESAIRNLGDIRARVQPGPFQQELHELQESLYSKTHQPWKGQTFWQSFNTATFILPILDQRPGEPLPPLYHND